MLYILDKHNPKNTYKTYDDKEACRSSKNEHHFGSFHIILAEQFDFMCVTYFHILRSCIIWKHEIYKKKNIENVAVNSDLQNLIYTISILLSFFLIIHASLQTGLNLDTIMGSHSKISVLTFFLNQFYFIKPIIYVFVNNFSVYLYDLFPRKSTRSLSRLIKSIYRHVILTLLLWEIWWAAHFMDKEINSMCLI